MCKNAQNCGKTRVFTWSVSDLQHEGQNRGFGEKAKIYFWCRTHHHFCVFRCRASFLQKTVFVSKIDEISLKTTENVVPNWRGRKTQFLHPRARNRLSWSWQRNFPDIFVAALSLLSHSSSRRQDNCFIFLTSSLLDNRSLSIILTIELFFRNKYLTFFFHGSGQFFCVLVGCLCFFSVGASASDSPSSFLSLSSILPYYFSSCCLSSFLGCMSSCYCVLFSLPLAYFLSLVFPSLHHLCYSCLLLFSLLLLCMYLVWLFLLLWFLSLFFLFLIFRFFSAPGPRAHLNRKPWNRTYFILLAFRGSLWKCPFTESLFLFSLVTFFHAQNMFLFHVLRLRLSFEGVRDYLLLLLFCFFLFWCLEQSLLSVKLVSCACMLWICLLCLRSSSFWCFCLCGVSFLGSGLFLLFFSTLVVILGLSFLDCSVQMLLLLLHVLAARLSVGFFGLPFYGNTPGGSYGYGQPGGVNLFFGFSDNQGVWVKTAAALREEGFFNYVLFRRPVSKRRKRTPVFNFVTGNAIKMGVPEKFFFKKSDPRLFTFFSYIFWPENIQLHAFGGSSRKGS